MKSTELVARSDARAVGGEPTLPVTEIFHSIQGESTWVGTPCTFVRLTGCPLRCVWCDTAYAFHGGSRMTLTEIVDRILETACPVVELTGGEPLAHPNARLLVERLRSHGLTVLIETSGSEDVSGLPPEVHVIMDLKCPGSGEVDRNRWENLDHLDERDEVKFVVRDRADYDWARATIEQRGLDLRVREGTLGALLIAPVWGADGPGLQSLAEWILQDDLSVRLQTQLHKHIWGPAQPGV